MEINIVYMHRIKNNGLFLQAYALKEKLNEYMHTVSFINFNDEMHKDVNAVNKSSIKKVEQYIDS